VQVLRIHSLWLDPLGSILLLVETFLGSHLRSGMSSSAKPIFAALPKAFAFGSGHDKTGGPGSDSRRCVSRLRRRAWGKHLWVCPMRHNFADWRYVAGRYYEGRSLFASSLSISSCSPSISAGTLYYRNVLGVKIDDGKTENAGGFEESDLQTAGLAPSIALFLLTWILTHTVRSGGPGPIILSPPTEATSSPVA
jgi:hypothetical protein